MILYPAIDVRDGHAVRLMRGDYDQETVYDADPAEAARRWAAEGARYLHVVDLDGAREGRPMNLEAVERIASAVDVLVQVGGGLRSKEAIDAALNAGAARVVLGTAAMRDRELVGAALDAHGERLVISVDARGGRVAVEGWTESGDDDVATAVGELSSEGVRHFMFTPIDVDGTMEGPGIGELRRVADATESELIYSGGVGELAHLRTLASEAPANVTGVIVGRALYEGRFTVAEAQEALTGP